MAAWSVALCFKAWLQDSSGCMSAAFHLRSSLPPSFIDSWSCETKEFTQYVIRRDVPIQSRVQKSGLITWFRSYRGSGIGYICMYLYCHYFFFRSIIFQNKWGKCVCARHRSGIGRHNDHCRRFLCLGSCLHVTPQVVHLFVTMELHSKQSSTKEPAIVAEGYLMCQCFTNMHSAARFSVPPQKKKTWFLSL